jgi:hypothetical protein
LGKGETVAAVPPARAAPANFAPERPMRRGALASTSANEASHKRN